MVTIKIINTIQGRDTELQNLIYDSGGRSHGIGTWKTWRQKAGKGKRQRQRPNTKSQ